MQGPDISSRRVFPVRAPCLNVSLIRTSLKHLVRIIIRISCQRLLRPVNKQLVDPKSRFYRSDLNLTFIIFPLQIFKRLCPGQYGIIADISDIAVLGSEDDRIFEEILSPTLTVALPPSAVSSLTASLALSRVAYGFSSLPSPSLSLPCGDT